MGANESLVLVAEDSPDDRLLLREALAASNAACRVEMVEDGQKALDYLFGAAPFADRRKFPLPRVMLIDLKMPVKDGFEVLRGMRADERFLTLPALVLSASAEPADIEQAFRLGANAYLVKPSMLADLEELIKAIASFWLRFNRSLAVSPS